jgi:hypothetical protein
LNAADGKVLSAISNRDAIIEGGRWAALLFWMALALDASLARWGPPFALAEAACCRDQSKSPKYVASSVATHCNIQSSPLCTLAAVTLSAGTRWCHHYCGVSKKIIGA